MVNAVAVHTRTSPSTVAEGWILEDILVYSKGMNLARAQLIGDMSMAAAAGFSGGEAAKSINKIIAELTD